MKDGQNREHQLTWRAIPGAAKRHLPTGVEFMYPKESVFEAMLDGWAKQMKSRALASLTIENRVRLVKRLQEFTNDYPWDWLPVDLEDWSSTLRSQKKPVAHSTLRGYQQSIALFLDYLTDRRYGWGDECEQRFGTYPIQICHEWNTTAHRDAYEGRPEVRPFSRKELQSFFDFCDEKVARARRLGRKGWLAAFRDSTIFKVMYGWGLRRTEASKLDLVDFGPNPKAPEFGGYGTLVVRWGKAMAGSPPRRRSVLTVWDWAAEAAEEYVQDVRPLYARAWTGSEGAHKREGQKALWPTERGARVSADYITMRFASYREELGLPEELHPHCLRHSYVTHLIEDGYDQLFVQDQVGHKWGSTTSLYAGVSSDYKNHVLRKALSPIYGDINNGSVNGLADRTDDRDRSGVEHDADDQREAR